MAKRKFSPAQLRAQRLFAQRARAGTLRKGTKKRSVKRRATPKRRAPRRKVIKRKAPRKRMAKRRGTVRRAKQKIINRIPILKNPAVKEIAMGLGMARIVSTGARAVPIPIIQQNAQILGTASAFAVDLKAGIVDLALSGGLGSIGGLLSGGNSAPSSNGGFA